MSNLEDGDQRGNLEGTPCPECGTADLGAVVSCTYFVKWSSLESAGYHKSTDLPELAVVRIVCGECGHTETATAEQATIALASVPFDN